MVKPPSRGVAVALVCAALVGCRELPGEAGDAAAAAAADRAHELLVFVYDRSLSMKGHELEHARELTRERLRDLDHGDRIVALELLRHALDEEPIRWSQQVPAREFAGRSLPGDSVSRARFIRDASEYIVRFSDPEGRSEINGTDILSTLHLVASELRADPGAHATLYLFSDMLQASTVLNMERGYIAGPAWVREQEALGALPDLRGLCVVVVGALEDGPETRAVRRFWETYFAAAGAILEAANYSYRPVRLPRGCTATATATTAAG